MSSSSHSPKSTTSIDPNQLLTLCQQIRENLAKLEKSIRLAQLRLDTLKYIRHEVRIDSSSYCFDSLFVVCNLSQLLVQQLDELQSKMTTTNMLNSVVDYQIASQQLMYFTSEWYHNLLPELNKTFEIASQLNVGFGRAVEGPATATTLVGGTRRTKHQKRTDKAMKQTGDTRSSDALLRLRQSMRENERLIALIANNVEYTKTTVGAIYDSLQVTKLDLGTSEKNIASAIDLTRRVPFRWKLVLFLVFVVLICVLAYIFV